MPTSSQRLRRLTDLLADLLRSLTAHEIMSYRDIAQASKVSLLEIEPIRCIALQGYFD